MIDDAARNALLLEAHRLIEMATTKALEAVDANPTLTYPPAGGGDSAGLSRDEQQALLALNLSAAAKSGMRKIVANAIAETLFGLFCVMDGVGDPDGWNGSTWLGIDLAAPEKGRHRPMLHDELFETYWRFSERRG